MVIREVVYAELVAQVPGNHHHILKETTVASGPWEGFVKNENGNLKCRYHGYFPDGGP